MLFPSNLSIAILGFTFILWLINETIVEVKNQTKNKNICKESKLNNKFLEYGTICSIAFLLVMLYVNRYISPIGLVEIEGLSYFGSALAFIGIVIRRSAINTLKQHFDGLIQIKEEQELITNGMYAFIRHPSYTGSVLTFIGFGIASLNIYVFMVLSLFIFTIYRLRIRIEEGVLISGFGEKYVVYQKSTSTLFPNIFNLIKQNKNKE